MIKFSDFQAAIADKNALLSEVASLKESIASLTGERDTLAGELADAVSAHEVLKGERDGIELALNEARGEIAQLQASAKTVADATVEKLHELGVPAAELPAAAAAGEEDEALLERYQGMQGAERTAFFRGNRAALERAAARVESKH
jgi:chromosome segregation ATPase